jgi:uncharacterized LabA/DUF88 family protein
LINPVSGATVDLGAHPNNAKHISLQQTLELQSDFEVRLGETAVFGWTVGIAATRSLQKSPRMPSADDFVPEIRQKGVDLYMGLDIARLSLRRFVDVIVVVSGDSDLVPAFKLARHEGIRVYLDHLGHTTRRELKANTDLIL